MRILYHPDYFQEPFYVPDTADIDVYLKKGFTLEKRQPEKPKQVGVPSVEEIEELEASLLNETELEMVAMEQEYREYILEHPEEDSLPDKPITPPDEVPTAKPKRTRGRRIKRTNRNVNPK